MSCGLMWRTMPICSLRATIHFVNRARDWRLKHTKIHTDSTDRGTPLITGKRSHLLNFTMEAYMPTTVRQANSCKPHSLILNQGQGNTCSGSRAGHSFQQLKSEGQVKVTSRGEQLEARTPSGPNRASHPVVSVFIIQAKTSWCPIISFGDLGSLLEFQCLCLI